MINALRFGWLSATIGLLGLAAASVAQANNIRVTNVGLTKRDPGAKTANVVFDLAWENSWRDGDNYRDAAWVFVKFRAPGSNNWEHAKLSTANHTAPSGSTIDVGSDGTNGMGVFIYSSANYTGSVNYAKTKLRWQYGSNGTLSPKVRWWKCPCMPSRWSISPQARSISGPGGARAAISIATRQ